MNPLISVIIPVYNTERYLRRCMDSIIHQTYQNLEIICVDDGSTDGSGELLDAYAEKDERITVVHKANGGLVAARKTGIAHAAGDYVSYVDSDDEIVLTRYEDLMDKGIRQQADIIFTDVTQVYADGSRLHMKNHYAEGLYERAQIESEILTHLCDLHHFFTYGLRSYLCGTLISRPLLCICQQMVDDAISYGEDVACMIPLLDHAKSVYMAHTGMYFYHKNADSMCHAIDASGEGGEKARCSIRAWYFHMKGLDVQIPAELQPNFREALKILIFYDVLMYDYAGVMQSLDATGDAETIFPYGVPRNHRVVLYGAGALGMNLYRYLSKRGVNIVLWCDRAWESYRARGYDVHSPEELQHAMYDNVLMGIGQYEITEKAAAALVKMGIPEDKIVFMKMQELTRERLERVYETNI